MRLKLIAVFAVLLAVAPAASAQSPELSTSDRLDERRYVANGTWAYVVGTQAGNFPAMGFHTRGEMGGVWSPPLKLLDGIWFAVNGRWLNDAARFTSGYGYTRMEFPERSGLKVSRTDFVPDGQRAAMMELRLRSTGRPRTVSVWVDARSELMSAYPWGETTPSQLTVNGQDQAAYADGALNFSEPGKPWRTAVASRPPPAAGSGGPAVPWARNGPGDLPAVRRGAAGAARALRRHRLRQGRRWAAALRAANSRRR